MTLKPAKKMFMHVIIYLRILKEYHVDFVGIPIQRLSKPSHIPLFL